MSDISWDAVRDEAAGYLRDLLRIDTTNPPGNERAAAEYIADVLSREGFEPRLFEPAPERVSVLARLAGSGERGPLLLQGHTDVVPADPSEWSWPPFSGDLADGCIWGRGALDMKGTVVMQLMALLLAERTGLRPRGDIIFAALADEEAGGFLGAGWLVDNEPDLVRAEVALGEVGGFTMYVGDRRFYPIQVSEKVGHGLTITVRGASGHGSQPIRDGAMAKAGEILSRLTGNRLPHHVTPVTEQFVRALARAQPQLLGLLDPDRVGQVLGEMGQDARMFEALLHNTAVPTVIQGGSKTNVIPGSVQITVDGRLLPGQTSGEFMREVRDLLGDDLEVETRHTPSFTEAPVDGFFAQFQQIIDEMDPGAIVVPALVSGVTDARFFARLGTPTYGFGPVKLSRDMPFWSLFHSADERIPVDGLLCGSRAVFRVLEQY
ncbi:MAG: M20/M25/M40 family metallo-hydrolase [Chloroflexi bacterium]|nr:M20/M25/M40 family metallo-hydrolase [Chloroflexota bacterium]